MSSRYNTGPDDLVTKIANLEARLSRLERVPRLSSAAIDSGRLEVIDNTGAVRVQAGLLDDGSYGLSVLEEDQVTLHQVPFVYTATVMIGEVCSSSSYTDLTTPGPTVVVPVKSSGRILILATAQVQWSSLPVAGTVTGDGRFDVAFSGANTRTPNEVVDPLVGIAELLMFTTPGTNSHSAAFSLTAQAVFEGLNAGSTNITMKYARSSGASGNPTIFRRTLTVFTL